MSGNRPTKEYNEGPRREMTRAWKLRVLAVLAENAAATPPRDPSTIGALARLLGADKTGMGRTLDPDGAQTSSTYVDAICELLQIDPPMQPAGPVDEELERELDVLRALPADERAALLNLIRVWRRDRSA